MQQVLKSNFAFLTLTHSNLASQISAHDYLLILILRRAESLFAAIVSPPISSLAFLLSSPPRPSLSEVLPSHLPS